MEENLGENSERKKGRFCRESPAVDRLIRMVICMKGIDPKYQWILDEYPEIITKEQLYKICHVSKKTALHYLVNGLIPCTCTGMKTRKFKIRTVDVVLFLQARDENAEVCTAPRGWYGGQYKPKGKEFPKIFTPAMQKKAKDSLELILQDFPDVMNSHEIEKATGYAHNTVMKWCARNKIKYFNIKGRYMIPKIVLIEYLTENRCHALSDQAYEYITSVADGLAELDDPDQPDIIV